MLRAHPSNGSWGLSEPTTTDVVKGTVANPLVHLEWSPTTSPDLAIFDSAGRVFIMNFPVSLNSPYLNRKWDADAVDDMNVVVGCHWLPVAPLPQVSRRAAETRIRKGCLTAPRNPSIFYTALLLKYKSRTSYSNTRTLLSTQWAPITHIWPKARYFVSPWADY